MTAMMRMGMRMIFALTPKYFDSPAMIAPMIVMERPIHGFVGLGLGD